MNAQPASDILARLAILQRQCRADAEIAAHRAEQAESNRQSKIIELRAHWGAPERHLQCTPDHSGPWGEAFGRLATRIGSGFIVALLGIRGNGKTQLAVELMRHATEKLLSARFTTAMAFFMAMKGTYRRDATQTEEQVLAEYAKPSLLVIDEVGRRGQSEWENNLLFELINRRYNCVRDTVVIANMTPAELGESIGPSILSRLSETGGIVECTWPSYR